MAESGVYPFEVMKVGQKVHVSPRRKVSAYTAVKNYNEKALLEGEWKRFEFISNGRAGEYFIRRVR